MNYEKKKSSSEIRKSLLVQVQPAEISAAGKPQKKSQSLPESKQFN